MEIGFLEPGHNLYCGDDARQIIPRVQALIDRERAAGSRVLFTADLHEVDGQFLAKRGRLPGITPSPRLKRVR